MINLHIREKKSTNYLITAIFALAFIVRFWDLGYSHFFGDETKTFYLDKTVSATEFFLDQRKGPVQFFVVWVTEKIIGGYDEFYTRIPFALAGFVSCLVFYLLVKEWFGDKIANLAVILFAFNGFNIAFSRTIQYQSFMILFGLSGLYLLLKYFKNENKYLLILSSLSFALGLLSHYDAVFFLLPALYLLYNNYKEKAPTLSEVLLFLLPVFFAAGSFYLPYILSGKFHENTCNYVQKRLSGQEYSLNYSLYTIEVYNPLMIFMFISALGWVVSFINKNNKTNMLFIWFLVPFLIFELIILNPGTHINNYLIPMIIMSAIAVYYIYENLYSPYVKKLFSVFMVVFIAALVIVNGFIYLPHFNKKYPWSSQKLGLIYFKPADKYYHLFLYGFPYNRGWDMIREYFSSLDGVRGVYTNDNDTVAQYYLRGFNYTPPGSNFLPQYYINIRDSQEIIRKEYDFTDVLNTAYCLQEQFYLNNEVVAEVYKKNL